jgi:16S rRNA (guanine527-N7)-methyltransferase
MPLKEKNSHYDIAREITELKEGMNELGIAFDSGIINKFRKYLDVLYFYHGKIHLLSHRDYERISRRHFLPSLVAVPHVRKHERVCDVGSGAGFPSIPLYIVLPEIALVIFEAQRKKAHFLRYLVETLGLAGIDVVDMRAEQYSGRTFDLALLKAVGAVKEHARLLDKLLEKGGEAIFYKTLRVEEELKNAASVLDKLHFTAEVRKVYTPLEKRPLALVILRKM